MRRGMSVQVVVFAVGFCVVLFGVLPGQVVLANDQDGPFRDGDPSMSGWTSLADLIEVDENQSWVSEPETPRAAWIVDDFEDGNIDGWIDEGGGACYGIDVGHCGERGLQHARGRSLRTYLGRVLDITGSMPTGISFSVRADTVNTFDTYFVLGDSASGSGGNTGAIDFPGNPDGTWSVFNGTDLFVWQSQSGSVVHRLVSALIGPARCTTFRSTACASRAMCPFYYVATEAFDRIHVYNWSSATARYDEIYFYTPGVSPLIFEDDFERGSPCRWSAVAP